MLTHQTCEFLEQPVSLRGKEMPRLVGCLDPKLPDPCQGWTIAVLVTAFAFRDTNDTTRFAHALVLVQQFAPVPGAQIPLAKALIHQVKEVGGKFEHPQGVHDVEFHAITYPLRCRFPSPHCHTFARPTRHPRTAHSSPRLRTSHHRM